MPVKACQTYQEYTDIFGGVPSPNLWISKTECAVAPTGREALAELNRILAGRNLGPAITPTFEPVAEEKPKRTPPLYLRILSAICYLSLVEGWKPKFCEIRPTDY